MIKKIFFLLLFLPTLAYCQSGITFDIEELSKPERLEPLMPYHQIYENLILKDRNLSRYDIERSKTNYQYDIIAKSKAPDSLIYHGYQSFFDGMFSAYADHRPFVLSPDMIWLLISQGFAQHVNNNSEKLRHYFVDFEGKVTLIVITDEITLDNPDSPWEKAFPEFTKQIAGYTGNDLINALTCDFTTTTPITKVAGEITIMEAMKSYFEYIVMYVSCGIPKITLEGTPEDWQKVLDKAKYLKKYELGWWIRKLEPILEEFVNASKGDIDKKFWRKMFKYHTDKQYGAPAIVDGWIVKFFPYDKDGNKLGLNQLEGTDALPKEIVKVDLKYIKINPDGSSETTPLELWAGFIGLEQNPNTFALKPQIGWMIKKSNQSSGLKTSIEMDNANQQKYKDSIRVSGFDAGPIRISVKSVPKEILELNEIYRLQIDFVDQILIPDQMGKIKIHSLRLNGKISKSEIERICKLLPNTKLRINGENYN